MCRFASFSRVKHLREVGPLSRPVMWSMYLTQPVSAPLQSSLRFFPDLLSAPPSVHLAMYLSPCYGGAVWIYPVPAGMILGKVRSTLYAGSVCLPMTADARAAVLTARRAAQHFRLSVPHDAYEHLCILTVLPEPSPVLYA